jgi:hypothetical protein
MTLVLFCFWPRVSLAQKFKTLDDSIQSEIRVKIPKLKKIMESNEMNPAMKSVISDFAIDTFKIEYYQRRKLNLHVTVGTMVSVTKYVTAKYRSLVDKYYFLATKEANPDEKRDLVATQEAWETFQKKEVILLSRIYSKGDIGNCNYLMAYQKIIRERAIALFDRFTQIKEY